MKALDVAIEGLPVHEPDVPAGTPKRVVPYRQRRADALDVIAESYEGGFDVQVLDDGALRVVRGSGEPTTFQRERGPRRAAREASRPVGEPHPYGSRDA